MFKLINVDAGLSNTPMKYVRVKSKKLGTEWSMSMSCESKFTIETPDHLCRSGNNYPCDFPFSLTDTKPLRLIGADSAAGPLALVLSQYSCATRRSKSLYLLNWCISLKN